MTSGELINSHVTGATSSSKGLVSLGARHVLFASIYDGVTLSGEKVGTFRYWDRGYQLMSIQVAIGHRTLCVV